MKSSAGDAGVDERGGATGSGNASGSGAAAAAGTGSGITGSGITGSGITGTDGGVAMRWIGGTGEARRVGTDGAGGAIEIAATAGGVATAVPPAASFPKSGSTERAKSSFAGPSAAMAMTPPHTAQRARTPGAGTRAGSTLNTERQSPQVTFIAILPWQFHQLASCGHRSRRQDPDDDPP
jgi:hypothetical protein